MSCLGDCWAIEAVLSGVAVATELTKSCNDIPTNTSQHVINLVFNLFSPM